MPFDKALYEGYCVQYSEKKYRKDKNSLFCFLAAMLGCCCLFAGIFAAVENEWGRFAVWLPYYLLFFWLLLRWRAKPEPERMKIWVQGDSFCTQTGAQRSRRYRFAEITRVSYHSQHGKLHKMPRIPSCWAIYVGEDCVAAFQKDMENAHRLLKRLDKMGLITTYGSGYTWDT